MKRIVVASLLFLAAGIAVVFAQQPPPPKEPTVFFYQAGPQGAQAGSNVIFERKSVTGGGGEGAPGAMTVIGGTEFLMDTDTVKGAPYSADSITESVQTLADGNRIVHSSSSKVYRDSEGRTRRELSKGDQALSVFQLNGAPINVSKPEVFIIDPASGVNYSLDTEGKTARKMKVLSFQNSAEMKARLEAALTKSKASGGQTVTITEPGKQQMVVRAQTLGEENTESLGTQVIEDVQVEGKRTTTTIPAGKIGNEREIVITNETWFSPKLQTMVLTKHHDPRFGDTTFKLSNINQSEPPASLFQVPSDYTVVESKSLIEQKVKLLPRERFE